MTNAGYDEIVIEDFYDTLLDAFKKLAEVPKEKAQEHLLQMLCDPEQANYMIMYIPCYCLFIIYYELYHSILFFQKITINALDFREMCFQAA